MVDSIKHNLRQIIAPASQDAKQAAGRAQAPSASIAANLSGASDVTNVSVKASVSALTENPPIDTETVGRIKQAIADGKYPINLDLVSERLMESYLEMKG